MNTSTMISNRKLGKNTVLRVNGETKGMEEFTLTADFANANNEFFDELGDKTAHILYKSYDGSQFYSSGYKGLFRFVDEEGIKITDPSTAFRKLLTNGTIYIPHEVAHRRFDRAITNFNRNADNFGKLKLVDEYEAHNGYTHYWVYMSEKQHQVQKGDIIRFGIVFRNGIGTLTSLGGDLYSYRLTCANGAIARDKKLGSFNIPHRNSTKRMLEQLTDGLANTIEAYKTILEYYKAFTQIKLSQGHLTKIVRDAEIPLKYLNPEWFEVITPKDDKNLLTSLVKLRKGVDITFWQFFNSITDPLSRSAQIPTTPDVQTSQFVKKVANRKINYASFVEKTSALHRVMFSMVSTPEISVSKRRSTTRV